MVNMFTQDFLKYIKTRTRYYLKEKENCIRYKMVMPYMKENGMRERL